MTIKRVRNLKERCFLQHIKITIKSTFSLTFNPLVTTLAERCIHVFRRADAQRPIAVFINATVSFSALRKTKSHVSDSLCYSVIDLSSLPIKKSLVKETVHEFFCGRRIFFALFFCCPVFSRNIFEYFRCARMQFLKCISPGNILVK